MAHKILLSAPVPWIGDLGLGDWGLGLDNKKVLFKGENTFPQVFENGKLSHHNKGCQKAIVDIRDGKMCWFNGSMFSSKSDIYMHFDTAKKINSIRSLYHH